eukprot:4831100-Pleurochrysis_carterae.AAC.2
MRLIIGYLPCYTRFASRSEDSEPAVTNLDKGFVLLDMENKFFLDVLKVKYHDARGRGHIVTPLMMETFGGMAGHPRPVLLRQLALLRDARFLLYPLSAALSAAPLVAYHAQLLQSISPVLYSAVARHILVFACLLWFNMA